MDTNGHGPHLKKETNYCKHPNSQIHIKHNMNVKKKKTYIRRELRKRHILPPYGNILTNDQQFIWDQINRQDFSYYENLLKREHTERQVKKRESRKNPLNRNTPNRRYYVTKRLREEGFLPKFGAPMNEEEEKILKQVKNGDYTFYNENVNEKTNISVSECLCKKCGNLNCMDFYVYNRSTCKSCISKQNREKYLNPSERSRIKKNSNKYVVNNIFNVRFQAAKHRSLRKGWDFSITFDFLKEQYERQNGRCFISNIKMSLEPRNIRTLSIDRLDPSEGYTKKNTVLVTHFVNISKSQLSKDRFIDEIISCYEGIRSKGSFQHKLDF